jgi:hypothetical protein
MQAMIRCLLYVRLRSVIRSRSVTGSGRDLSLTGAVHGPSRALGGEEPTAATSQNLLPNSE